MLPDLEGELTVTKHSLNIDGFNILSRERAVLLELIRCDFSDSILEKALKRYMIKKSIIDEEKESLSSYIWTARQRYGIFLRITPLSLTESILTHHHRDIIFKLSEAHGSTFNKIFENTIEKYRLTGNSL